MHHTKIVHFPQANQDRLQFHCHGRDYIMPFGEVDARKSVLLYMIGCKDRRLRLAKAVDICHQFTHTGLMTVSGGVIYPLILAFCYVNKLMFKVSDHQGDMTVYLK